jgi:hypothetical protein
MNRLEGIPSLAEMTLLSFDVLPEMARKQGESAAAAARHYDLGWFRHEPTGLVFLGIMAPEASDHSRWIVCMNPDKSQVWYGVLAEGMSHPRAQPIGGLCMYSTSPREAFLNDYLKQLRTTYDMLVNRARKTAMPDPSLKLMVQHTRLLPDASLDHAVIALRYDTAYLHGILHHYDAWALEHPDFAEMPRDIVMRSHGLGFYTQYSYL